MARQECHQPWGRQKVLLLVGGAWQQWQQFLWTRLLTQWTLMGLLWEVGEGTQQKPPPLLFRWHLQWSMPHHRVAQANLPRNDTTVQAKQTSNKRLLTLLVVSAYARRGTFAATGSL